MLECVVNVSEGRDHDLIAKLARAGGPAVLDVHSDPDHHRSVLTLAGSPGPLEEAVRSLARATLGVLDIRAHAGVHPRLGALDVVPFVAFDRAPRSRLVPGPVGRAVAARDRFGGWAGQQLVLPCFVYGPERSLPEVRRRAWSDLTPDYGPSEPHPTAGATAIGARPALVAYNLWLVPGPTLQMARTVAAGIRGPAVRALGLTVAGGRQVQVSCNLVDPWRVGPGAVFDAVASAPEGLEIERAELVGLLPAEVLEAEPAGRWAELGLGPTATIEARLEQAGLDGGRF